MKYDPSTGQMDFSLALLSIKRGNAVTRAVWRGGLTVRKNGSAIFLAGNMPSGRVVDEVWEPWPEDLLADDWLEVI